MQGLSKTPVCLGLPRTATPPVRTHSPEAEPGAAEEGPGAGSFGGSLRTRGVDKA